MSYHSNIWSHGMVLLFLLPPAYGFLLGTLSVSDSHLLVPALNLFLISILLYFGKLLWIFYLIFFDLCVFFFISSFSLVLYYPPLFWCITLSGLHQILGYSFLLTIYPFLFYSDDFIFHCLFYFFYFLHYCHFHLPFCIYLHLFLCIYFDTSHHAIPHLY